jgi:hypothetical protein
MSNFVTCKLYGGLGNQLFQIFTTIAYSLQHNLDFVFLYSSALGKRPTYWHTFLASICHHTTHSIPEGFMQIEQGTHQFTNLANPLPNQNVMLNGYFQSFLFFDDHFKTISKMVDVEKQQSMMQMHENSISLHFRRGDYKDLQDCHPILRMEYYANALNYILTFDDSISHVYYYCEEDDLVDVEKDIAVLKNEFRQNILFVRHFENTDWEEMLSMSCCKHNIIANSSFSWWGAYLNPNPNKMVCYPSVWFGPLIPENTDTMFPEKWIKIE